MKHTCDDFEEKKKRVEENCKESKNQSHARMLRKISL
jgi:hypothetical protein